MRSRIAVVLVVAGCGKGGPPAPRAVAEDATAVVAAVDAAGAAPIRCERLPFAESIEVPEASGTAILPIDGAPAIVVVADSGNHGAYAIVDPDTGALRETGALPLGRAGTNDDVEGLAVRDGRIYGITSSGWIRAWTRVPGGFALVDGPYPVAPLASGRACVGTLVNCGKNYEGLCLTSGAAKDGECIGLAAAKADGALYCVAAVGDRLVVTDQTIAVSAPETLTGCDVAPDDGAVWAGTNVFGLSKVYRITGWTTPATAQVEDLGSLGTGFPESIAVGPGDVVYRFSDVGGTPSLVTKFRCTTGGR